MSASNLPRHSPDGDTYRPGATPHGPARSSAVRRPTASSPSLIDVSHRLRPRDLTIANLLDEHTTLTTQQLTDLLFISPTSCRHRLDVLRDLGFVDRFFRHRPGLKAHSTCWVPGMLAARFASLARGDTPLSARALRELQDRICTSPKLEHTLAVNQFFVTLLAYARPQEGLRLARWWSESTATAAFGRRVFPDGHGVWVDGERAVGFFLELDRGSEPLRRLVDKLAAYRRLRAEGGPAYAVLFALPNRTREQNLHRRLAEAPEPSLVIATKSPESGSNPADEVWRLAGNGRHRLALADLPASHGQPGPLNPGPPGPGDDPLRLLRPAAAA